MSIRNEAPAVVVSSSAKDWYYALSTARSCAEIARNTTPPANLLTKASNEFWKSAKQKSGDRNAWQALVEVHEHHTFFLMKRENKVVGGFCIIAGELCGIWVEHRRAGQGSWLLRHAVAIGARDLNCFEELVPFYQRAGFVEVDRVPNWTPGGPDVVWMKLRGEV